MADLGQSPPLDAEARTVRAIQDVLLVTTGGIKDEDWKHHPLAGNPPVEVGRRVRLTQELSREKTESIMDACEPRGENFRPVRQFGCRYAFVRPLPPEEYERSYARWDHDDTLLAVFTLSRLIRDNAYSTEYAARVVELSDGRIQIMPGPVNLEGALAYRARAERDWLDTSEARELAALLSQFWASESQFSERVRNAIWLAEQSARCKYDFDALLTIVAGLEALLNTGPRQNTKQFAQRAPDLAREVGIDGISRAMARRLYERRSDAAHGRRLRLISPRPNEPTPSYSEREARAIRELALIQDLLRAAVRRSIEDGGFAAHFVGLQDVRAKWPVSDGEGNPL